jgi:hypothetical protein
MNENPEKESRKVTLNLKWLTFAVLIPVGVGACLAVAIASLSGRSFGKPNGRFAVVDLATVVRKNQEAAVSLLTSGAADQRARDAALASAQGFGKRLDAEVVALSKECGCVLLMREAVVAGEVEDLTPALLSRLNKQ